MISTEDILDVVSETIGLDIKKAIKREIAKKPNSFDCCPTCDRKIDVCNYCAFCGQKIDWSKYGKE